MHEAGASRPDLAVTPGERLRAFATLLEAFRDDPVERWLYPDDAGYERHFPAFLEAFGGQAVEDGTARRLGDFDAVALWIAPGAEPDGEAIAAVLRATVPGEMHADVFATLARSSAAAAIPGDRPPVGSSDSRAGAAPRGLQGHRPPRSRRLTRRSARRVGQIARPPSIRSGYPPPCSARPATPPPALGGSAARW